MDYVLSAIILMILIMVVLGYFINATISIKQEHVTHNLNKFYMSVLMGLQMGILEVIYMYYVHDMPMTPTSKIFFLFLIVGMIYVAYRLYTLDFIEDDKEFVKSMIEHHGMALSMVNNNKETANPRLRALMNNIKTTQEAEINEMKEILKEL